MQKSTRRYLILSFISLFSFAADQISKILVDLYMIPHQSIEVIGNFLRITYVRNTGIVFGLFLDNQFVFWLVSALGVGVTFYILYYIYKRINEFSMLKLVAYGLIFGGALGNSYDRLFRNFVIDFIDFNGIWTFIFNGADAFINIAIILLLIDSYISEDK
ncbi:MAG TPA: signal peptidase II [Fusobacteria bacterium]|nr:signal peptidase II [Fusobacteriota bacterium]|tara:strand:+ start:1406 stop:1885 length:480 start_codon:yes stop_codon:yes gene_type:complete